MDCVTTTLQCKRKNYIHVQDKGHSATPARLVPLKRRSGVSVVLPCLTHTKRILLWQKIMKQSDSGKGGISEQ